MSIEEVYDQIEVEEQKRFIMIGKDSDLQSEGGENKSFALISCENSSRPPKRYFHCKKSDHTIDFCSNYHLERKSMREKDYKNSSNRKIWGTVESSEMGRQNNDEEKK